MIRRNLHFLLFIVIAMFVLAGCDLKNPDATSGLGAAILPTESSGVSQPATEPSIGDSLPENAVQQEDGNYVLTQYVNAMGSSVEKDKAEYINTTVYAPDARVLSVEQVSIKTGYMRYSESYQYDGTAVSCVTSRYYDKNGQFRMHYTEHFTPEGLLAKREDFDRDGNITQSAEYTYFDDGVLQLECCYDGNGIKKSQKEYDTQKRLIGEQRWHDNGTLQEQIIYADGKTVTQTVYDQNGELTFYLENWPNGQMKLSKTLGFYLNGERVNGWVIGEYSEEGIPQHDVMYYPDGSLHLETYYYPSGNTKSTYWRDPESTHNPEHYSEYLDGAVEPYSGWNMIDGEKVYFGKALQDQHPDWVYDDRGNLLQYTVTENGYTYEVKKTYDASNRCITEEWIGADGSRSYTENGTGLNGWECVYSEKTGRFCVMEDAVRYVYDRRSGMYYSEIHYANGTVMVDICSPSGNPYYLSYVYADGRKEIYEYDEGILTYMYIECEDGSTIVQGTPRES